MGDVVKHVVAHYRYKPRFVLRKLTIAQTLILFDGMVKLHVLTNPFGSGKDEKKSDAPVEVNAMSLRDHGAMTVKTTVPVTDLPPEIQSYLAEGVS